MKKFTRRLFLGALLLAPLSSAQPFPTLGPGAAPGFVPGLGLIILAERRFDPFVQRLMAERSLRALPLYGGQLFYLVPTASSGQAEMQIRYLEVLLRERGQREAESERAEARGDEGADPSAPAASPPED